MDYSTINCGSLSKWEFETRADTLIVKQGSNKGLRMFYYYIKQEVPEEILASETNITCCNTLCFSEVSRLDPQPNPKNHISDHQKQVIQSKIRKIKFHLLIKIKRSIFAPIDLR